MKKNISIFLLGSNLIFACVYSQNMDSYLATVQKVTTLMQTISQKIVSDSLSMTTRSSSSLSTEYYYKKMIEGLQEEIATIMADKNPEQLSPEEKDIIQMLETYIEQFKLFCPDLVQ